MLRLASFMIFFSVPCCPSLLSLVMLSGTMKGLAHFFVCLFQLKEYEKSWKWQILKPSPRKPLASNGHSVLIPNPALCLTSSSFQFPKLPLGLKVAFQPLSLNFYLFPAWVQPSYFCLPAPKAEMYFYKQILFLMYEMSEDWTTSIYTFRVGLPEKM